MNKINPKKLLNSKWTAVKSDSSEKHFIVSDIEFNNDEVVQCLLEAIITKRQEFINWHDLKNNDHWLHGWQ